MDGRKKGRPPVSGDEARLRRVAEHLVTMEERGEKCSPRAAMLRTLDGPADSVLRRLRRKWNACGDALMVEVREQRTRARARETAAVATYVRRSHLGGLHAALQAQMEFRRRLEDLGRFRNPLEEAMKWQRQLEDALNALRPSSAFEEAVEKIRRKQEYLDRLSRGW